MGWRMIFLFEEYGGFLHSLKNKLNDVILVSIVCLVNTF